MISFLSIEGLGVQIAPVTLRCTLRQTWALENLWFPTRTTALPGNIRAIRGP